MFCYIELLWLRPDNLKKYLEKVNPPIHVRMPQVCPPCFYALDKQEQNYGLRKRKLSTDRSRTQKTTAENYARLRKSCAASSFGRFFIVTLVFTRINLIRTSRLKFAKFYDCFKIRTQGWDFKKDTDFDCLWKMCQYRFVVACVQPSLPSKKSEGAAVHRLVCGEERCVTTIKTAV